MTYENQQSDLILLDQISKNELTEVVVELIKNDREVQMAIFNLVFSCPNVVTQI